MSNVSNHIHLNCRRWVLGVTDVTDTHPWGAGDPALRFFHVSNALRMAADLHVHSVETVGSTIARDRFSNLTLGFEKSVNFLPHVFSSSLWFLNDV